MKTDRELLELAARAAGLVIEKWIHAMGAEYAVTNKHSEINAWNPLTDDGDALRLAVAIPACIVIDNDMQLCGVHLNGNRGKYDLGQAFVGLNPAEATRRAIVRAAAEIGESMK